MKSSYIIILALLLVTGFISCKKDRLTQEDLDNSLNNIDYPSGEFKDWRLVINQTNFSTTDWVDTLNGSRIDFPIFPSAPECYIDNINFKYFWGEGKYSIYIDVDTLLLSGLNKSTIISNSSSYPYISELYRSDKYSDKLEIINVSLTEFYFYSTALGKSLKYNR